MRSPAAALIAGCGGGPDTQPQVDVGPNVGQPISLADCNDWNQANTEQRLGTIKQLKDFAGGPIVGNNASVSVRDGARSWTTRTPTTSSTATAQQSFARGFKLYKLYERAAAFTGQPRAVAGGRRNRSLFLGSPRAWGRGFFSVRPRTEYGIEVKLRRHGL